MEIRSEIIDVQHLKPGDHLCCLYENDEEHRAVLTPFLRMGLENNEKVIYIVDARTAETVLDYLREDGVKVEPYLKSGQLKILTVNDSYMKEGIFNPDKMIQLLESETKKAIDQGYSALRVTGEMSWALQGLPGSEKLIEYEAKLNQFFPENKCLAICQYDARFFDAEILLDILTTHPIAVIGTEFYDNLYYIPTKEYLGRKDPKIILEHWKKNLKYDKELHESLVEAQAGLKEKVRERTRKLKEINQRLEAEIKERIIKEKELKASKEEYYNIIKTTNEGVAIGDPNGGFTYINERFQEMLGYDAEEIIGHDILEFMDSSQKKMVKDSRFRCQANEKFQIECKFRRKDGTILWTLANASPLYDSNGKHVGNLAMHTDITKLKKVENQLKVALKEKELLLREIHHRVKNNLMIISSLLNLQSQYVHDPTSRDIFKESQNRARSMALIHERLYRSTDLKNIDFRNYTQNLVTGLLNSYSPDNVKLYTDIENIKLDVNIAVPLGLIINELVTNSLKHGFKGRKSGTLIIYFHKIDEEYLLKVIDDGVGFSDKINFQDTKTLGLQLVNNLVKQIDGTIEMKRGKGTEFIISFKS